MGMISVTTTATSLTAPALGNSSSSPASSQQGAALLQAQRGAPGAPGLSAYEVAVANGYQGTQAQWLASLTPPPAAESEVPDLTLIFENQLI